MEESKYIAFMATIRHTEIDDIVAVIQEYDSVTQYLIGLEVSPDSHQDVSGEHMHFLCDMSEKHYHNFADRIFRRKYKLRGQAKKGLPRQYGKLRQIHDFERMAAYTVKDSNIRTNMDQATVDKFFKLSHKKDEEKEFKEKVYKYLYELPAPEFTENNKVNTFNEKDPFFLRKSIIGYFRDNLVDKIPNSNTIRSYVTGYMLYYNPTAYSLEIVDSWIFGR